jgi:hypothetical protein
VHTLTTLSGGYYVDTALPCDFQVGNHVCNLLVWLVPDTMRLSESDSDTDNRTVVVYGGTYKLILLQAIDLLGAFGCSNITFAGRCNINNNTMAFRTEGRASILAAGLHDEVPPPNCMTRCHHPTVDACNNLLRQMLCIACCRHKKYCLCCYQNSSLGVYGWSGYSSSMWGHCTGSDHSKAPVRCGTSLQAEDSAGNSLTPCTCSKGFAGAACQTIVTNLTAFDSFTVGAGLPTSSEGRKTVSINAPPPRTWLHYWLEVGLR